MSFGRCHADRRSRWLFVVPLARCTVYAGLLLGLSLSCNRQPVPNGATVEKKSDAARAAASEEGNDDFAEPRPKTSGPQPPILFAAPKFELTDQTGGAFGTQQLAGHVWIANFMFTNCAATCPRQTTRLAELHRHARRWPDWERIRLVSITVDPERDSVKALHEYAEQHQADHERWKFLTGDRAELTTISKEGFKLPVSGAAQASTPITHSSRFVLVDAQLRVRGYYESLDDEDYGKLLTDLRLVLSEEAPMAKEPVYVGAPHEVFDPPWLESRRAAQLARAAISRSSTTFNLWTASPKAAFASSTGPWPTPRDISSATITIMPMALWPPTWMETDCTICTLSARSAGTSCGAIWGAAALRISPRRPAWRSRRGSA
jgi:protein SCO1/2